MNEAKSTRLIDYLEHIVQAIERVRDYVEDMNEVTFLMDRRTQDAVIRNFEIIGEACNNVTKQFPAYADSHPEIPWRFAYEMRNVLAHGYFKVDLEIVWRTIHHDLPPIHDQARMLLAVEQSRLPANTDF
jgi:uncharacterized protein with HEPN domain